MTFSSDESTLPLRNPVGSPSREEPHAQFTEWKLRPVERKALTHNHIKNLSFGTRWSEVGVSEQVIHLSEPQFPHLENRQYCDLKCLREELQEIMGIKPSAHG